MPNPFEIEPVTEIWCANCFTVGKMRGTLPSLPEGWETWLSVWCCPAEKCRKLLADAKEFAKTHNRDGTRNIHYGDYCPIPKEPKK